MIVERKPAVTRFAPSPSGLLHPGHAFSALQAWRRARDLEARFLLRIEDIDFARCRPEFETALKEDLAWLGLAWEEPVRRQSEHLADYGETIDRLQDRGVLYPCFCTRREIQAEIERAGGAPHGSEGPLYPGTCRRRSDDERHARLERGESHALRIDVRRALDLLPARPVWTDEGKGVQEARPELLGDAVLVRKDIGTSYHVAVVTDDALQGITHVVRGEDLFESTHLHRLLQDLLSLPVPLYHHHELIRDASGKRLAKRDESVTIRSVRESGMSAGGFRAQLGFSW